jgi:AraC-like DNA-binding protein
MIAESFSRWQIPRAVDGLVLIEDLAAGPGRIGVDQRHHHAELEVHLVARGRGVFLLAETRIEATPGTMLWVRPQEDHTMLEASRDFRRFMLLVRRRAMKRVLPLPDARFVLASVKEKAGDAGLCRVLPARVARALADRLAEVRSRSHVDPRLHNAAIAGALAEAFTAFCEASASPESSALHPSVAKAVRLLCDGEVELSRAEIARRAGLSAWHLAKLFREQVGVSLVEFRNRCRLERFLDLYGTGAGAGAKMTTAALDAGFGSYPQFHRIFRAAMGRSPAEWVRDARGA